MSNLPPFTLQTASGEPHVFPTGGHVLLCFVKEDCPTCHMSMPLIEAAHQAFGSRVPVWAIGQDAEGNAKLVDQYGLTVPMLDDSALKVSYAYDLDTVPTVILADATGAEVERFIGFGKADWQNLFGRMISLTLAPAPVIDWNGYPESRPGCGSKSVEPGIAERLAAEAEGSPLRARRIDVGESDDIFEFMFDQGLTDGLPVIPPTPERVLRMLGGTKRDPQSVIGIVAPNMAPCTVEKAAINAVMAGCKPEYLPVVIAAVEAICTEQFNIHGVLATTHFPTPVLIVNGPIRDKIGLNYRFNALGQGFRANATIGRAVQLIVRNVGGGRPGEVDRAALGQPGKFTFCIAEFEEKSNWEPLHVERGFAPTDSTVSVFAGASPTPIIDQMSRDAKSLANSYGMALQAVSHPKHYMTGETVVIIPPEHVDTFAKDGWTKQQVKDQIQLASQKPARALASDDDCREGWPPARVQEIGPDTLIPKFRNTDQIFLLVAGGPAGKFGAYLCGWASGPMGSALTTVKIDD